MANTIFLQKSTCLATGTFNRCQASKLDHPIHHLRFNSKIKHNLCSIPEQNLGLRFQNDATRKMNMAVYASIEPGTSFPAVPSLDDWKVWIFGAGTLITMLLSFTKGKWGPLLQLKEKFQTSIDEAERVADIVEDVAERVEKVAEEAVKNLPEGKLHDAAVFLEKVAEDVDRRAQNADDALEKVEDMEKKLESFIESNTKQEKTVTIAQANDQK